MEGFGRGDAAFGVAFFRAECFACNETIKRAGRFSAGFFTALDWGASILLCGYRLFDLACLLSPVSNQRLGLCGDFRYRRRHQRACARAGNHARLTGFSRRRVLIRVLPRTPGLS